jgi:hypothetical protein
MPGVRTLGIFLGLGLRLKPRRGNGRCNSTGRFLWGSAWRLESSRGPLPVGGLLGQDRGGRQRCR